MEFHGKGMHGDPRRPGDGSRGRDRAAKGKMDVRHSRQLPIPTPPPPPTGPKGKGKRAENVSTGSSSNAAESQLSALVAALTVHQDALPDKVRELVQTHQESNASAQAKALHKHVATQASAAKQLASLRARRGQYLTSWKDYVHKLSESLDQQLTDKANILAGFDAGRGRSPGDYGDGQSYGINTGWRRGGRCRNFFRDGAVSPRHVVGGETAHVEARGGFDERSEVDEGGCRQGGTEGEGRITDTPQTWQDRCSQYLIGRGSQKAFLRGPHMSHHGQCGPSLSWSHSVCQEDDFVSAEMALFQGAYLAHAVQILELGVNIQLPDPRLQDADEFSFVEADSQLFRDITGHGCYQAEHVFPGSTTWRMNCQLGFEPKGQAGSGRGMQQWLRHLPDEAVSNKVTTGSSRGRRPILKTRSPLQPRCLQLEVRFDSNLPRCGCDGYSDMNEQGGGQDVAHLPGVDGDICTASVGAREVWSSGRLLQDRTFADVKESLSVAWQPGTMCLSTSLPEPVPGSLNELNHLLKLSGEPWLDFWKRDVAPLKLSSELRAHVFSSPEPWGVPLAFRVFVDWSAGHDCAGWGLVLYAWNGWCWSYIGWAGDGMAQPSNTNNGAECQGLLVALAWAMSLPAQVRVDVVVDSTYAMSCALGQHHVDKNQDCGAPSAKVRFIMQWLERWGRPVYLHWTRSHVGTLGNELVDRVADFCAKRGHTGGEVPACMRRLLEHPLLDWVWAAGPAVPGLLRLDQLLEGKYEPSDRIPVECAEAILHDVGASHVSNVDRIALKLCTANVCMRSKGPALRKQFVEECVDIVAMQETRLGSDALYAADGWLVLQSASCAGSDGCAFWFHCGRLAEALGVASFGVDHVVVLEARCDWLSVRVCCGTMDVILVTFRAPHSLREELEIRDWWGRAKSAVLGYDKLSTVILLGDCNARVSFAEEEVVGLTRRILRGFCSLICVLAWVPPW